MAPIFSNEDIELLVWTTAFKNTPYNIVVRLIVATIYGARISELSELSSNNIHLDGSNSTIFIRTKKGGRKKPQPIPESLVPLFNVPISPMSTDRLHRCLRRLCKQAKVKLPERGGFHCIRRRVATILTEIEHSEISIHDFMRWAKPRQFSMLSRYRQTSVEETDKAILEKHPFVKLWEEIIPYLLSYNTSYTSNLCNDKI